MEWNIVTMPGPWIGDEWRYAITVYGDRLYREHDGRVEVMTGKGWRPMPMQIGPHSTPEQAVLAYDKLMEGIPA